MRLEGRPQARGRQHRCRSGGVAVGGNAEAAQPRKRLQRLDGLARNLDAGLALGLCAALGGQPREQGFGDARRRAALGVSSGFVRRGQDANAGENGYLLLQPPPRDLLPPGGKAFQIEHRLGYQELRPSPHLLVQARDLQFQRVGERRCRAADAELPCPRKGGLAYQRSVLVHAAVHRDELHAVDVMHVAGLAEMSQRLMRAGGAQDVANAQRGRPQAVRLAVLIERGGRELPIAADFVGRRVNVPPGKRVQVLLKENDDEEGVTLIESD